MSHITPFSTIYYSTLRAMTLPPPGARLEWRVSVQALDMLADYYEDTYGFEGTVNKVFGVDVVVDPFLPAGDIQLVIVLGEWVNKT